MLTTDASPLLPRSFTGKAAAATPLSSRTVTQLVGRVRVAAGKLRALAVEACARYRLSRRERRIRHELQVLDDRTLHDIGIHRDEIASLAAEMTSQADCTRIGVMRTLYHSRG